MIQYSFCSYRNLLKMLKAHYSPTLNSLLLPLTFRIKSKFLITIRKALYNPASDSPFNHIYNGLNVCLPAKISMLKLDPQCNGIRRWGFGEVIRSWRWEPSLMDLVPLWERPQGASFFFLPCEDTVRIQPTMNWEADPHGTESASTWSWTSRPPELWEINLRCL